MKNRIWVGKNDVGSSYQSDKELIIAENGNIREKVSKDDCRASDSYKYDIYNLNLKPCEIVEIIIDTETQKYEVKRAREIGWYLTESTTNNYAVSRYWDGEFWCVKPNEIKTYETIRDEKIKVVSEIIRDNEYLKSLE